MAGEDATDISEMLLRRGFGNSEELSLRLLLAVVGTVNPYASDASNAPIEMVVNFMMKSAMRQASENVYRK